MLILDFRPSTIPVVPAIPVVPGSFWLFAKKLIEKEEVHQTKLPFVKELDNFFSLSELKQKYLLLKKKRNGGMVQDPPLR